MNVLLKDTYFQLNNLIHCILTAWLTNYGLYSKAMKTMLPRNKFW